MTIICHQGSPCDPPFVDGVLFAAHPEDPALFVAEVTEDQATDLTRIPAFFRFGGDISKLQLPGAPSSDAPSGPVSRWPNKELLLRVKADWDLDAVQAKAVELGIDAPEQADRPGLIALVMASRAASDVVPVAPEQV